MMKKKKQLLHCFIASAAFDAASLLFFIFFTGKTHAALKLNEIYPAPQTGEYEWVELFNDQNETIDISSFVLLDLANNKLNFATTSAQPLSYILATSSSVLNNTGDTVFLKNVAGETIETASYSGSFTAEKTFARCPDGNGDWFTLLTITKTSSNSPACISLTPTPAPEPTITPIPTSTPAPTSSPAESPQSSQTTYGNIFLSEVFPYPETSENEWFELYNGNDFSVNLSNWYIDDKENGGSSPKLFSAAISAKSYTTVDITSSIFNNTGDSVRLLDASQSLKDSFEYAKTEKGKSWGKITFENDEVCLQNPSKTSPNNQCLNPPPSSQSVTQSKSSQESNSATPQEKPKISASISKLTPPTPAPYFELAEPHAGSYEEQNNNVLGATDSIHPDSKFQKSLIQSLSFFSFSQSLLTIIFILLRIKNRLYENNHGISLPSFYSERIK